MVLGRRWGQDDQAIRERMGVCLQQTGEVGKVTLRMRRKGSPRELDMSIAADTLSTKKFSIPDAAREKKWPPGYGRKSPKADLRAIRPDSQQSALMS